jgi:hypothetical protein
VGAANEFPGKEYDFASARSDVVQSLREACERVDDACLEAMEEGGERIAEWLETEAWLLGRYRMLLAHPGWLETVTSDVNAPLPSYSPVLEAQRLLFLGAWLSAGRGDANNVRTLLDEDMKFWRRTLASSDTLLSKMIAVAALTRHFSWGNIILRRLPADVAMNGVPRLWQDPISRSERSMLRCLTGEWVFINRMMKPIRGGASNPLVTDPALEEASTAQRMLWLALKPFVQFQDMSNRHAELLETVAETLDVPYERYPQALEQARAILSQATDGAFPPNRIYNMLGDILFAIALPDFISYAVRVADLEGVRRAAVLATELRSQGIVAGQVLQYLRDAQDGNPYNGEPFFWDEVADAIVFTGLEPGDRGYHVFLY